MKIQNVAIFQNKEKASISDFSKDIVTFLQQKGIATQIVHDATNLKKEDADLLICLGGDGSMLRCARALAPLQIPLFGINCGTLGFLASCEKDTIFENISTLLNGEFTLSHRLLLQIDICVPNQPVKSFLALNDCVLRSEHARAFTVNANFNGQKIPSYYGDGIIVATPTGSTAYSLAAGGPIVEPSVEVLLVTPICPHSLNQRPLVLPADGTLELSTQFKTTQTSAYASIDGQIHFSLPVGASVKITRSAVKAKIIRNTQKDFFSIVNKKLNWGIR